MEYAVKWIEDRCKALGEEGVAVLAVRMTNTNAIGLYESVGFKFWGTEKDSTVGSGEMAYRWMYGHVV